MLCAMTAVTAIAAGFASLPVGMILVIFSVRVQASIWAQAHRGVRHPVACVLAMALQTNWAAWRKTLPYREVGSWLVTVLFLTWMNTIDRGGPLTPLHTPHGPAWAHAVMMGSAIVCMLNLSMGIQLVGTGALASLPDQQEVLQALFPWIARAVVSNNHVYAKHFLLALLLIMAYLTSYNLAIASGQTEMIYLIVCAVQVTLAAFSTLYIWEGFREMFDIEPPYKRQPSSVKQASFRMASSGAVG